VGVKALPVPTDNEDYLCVFGANWTIVGTVSPNEIKCYTPPPRLLGLLFDSLNKGISRLTIIAEVVAVAAAMIVVIY